MRSAFQREIAFYRELGGSVGARVPIMYHGDVCEGSAVILLEDLSPAVPGDSTEGCSIDDAIAAVQALASIHARWWQDSMIAGLDWLWQPRGNNDRLQAARLIDKGWSMAPPEFRQVLSTAVAGLCSESLWSTKVTRKLDERPQTLTHPDFRLDNIFFDRRTNPAQVAIIDWGRVTFAPVAQSLAYLLGRESGLVASDIEKCLDVYQADMTSNGVPDYTPEQCRIDFRLGVLQVLAVSLWQFQAGANRQIDNRIFEMRRHGWERVNRVLMDFDCLSVIET